jgi:tRNA-Thr(GGU) m(6)t(6)A37 methyltransferase TsaA
MTEQSFEVKAIGCVESPLRERSEAPRQGDEGAPQSVVRFEASVAAGLADVRAGDDLLLLTWLDRAERDVLAVHPRGNPDAQLTGVFSTRSPDRPNPIGLHRVKVVAVHGTALTVRDLEAIDGTPVLDVKPVLGGIDER